MLISSNNESSIKYISWPENNKGKGSISLRFYMCWWSFTTYWCDLNWLYALQMRICIYDDGRCNSVIYYLGMKLSYLFKNFGNKSNFISRTCVSWSLKICCYLFIICCVFKSLWCNRLWSFWWLIFYFFNHSASLTKHQIW